MKKIFLAVFISFVFLVSFSSAHVNHYKKIKYLKYDLFLNNNLIGSHIFNFKKKGDLLHVIAEGKFKVSALGIELMNYRTTSEEIYQNEQLIKFNSKTKQNNKEKYVNLEIDKNENTIKVDGSSFKGKIDLSSMVGTWWNHQIVKERKQISAISGRIINQKVKFLGKQDIQIDKKNYKALHFHFLSDDNKPLKEKKLNIHVWYDAGTLLWIKSSYDKLGKWEYRLKDVSF